MADDKHGHVYFIQAGTGPIKIGWSKDVKSRLRDLQQSTFDRLTLLATIPGERADEQHLLKKFREHRLRGEWFEPDARLVGYIDLLKGSKSPVSFFLRPTDQRDRETRRAAWMARRSPIWKTMENGK